MYIALGAKIVSVLRANQTAICVSSFGEISSLRDYRTTSANMAPKTLLKDVGFLWTPESVAILPEMWEHHVDRLW